MNTHFKGFSETPHGENSVEDYRQSCWASRTYWWHSLTMRVLFLHVKWCITITAGEFCNILGTQSSKNFWNYSQTKSSWFAMTLHQCTLLF